jgi:U3 small nucleolar RNA-associated protein 14
MMHAGQKDADAVINLNKMEIDFESSIAESKNNSKSEIEFETEDIFNSSSNAEKSNEKLYLISRLYTAISA